MIIEVNLQGPIHPKYRVEEHALKGDSRDVKVELQLHVG
jgi:hypothetical protein